MNSNSLVADLHAIANSSEINFVELAAIAGLDPKKDFIDADLRGADLRNQDLREFNLKGADISGALTDGAQFNPADKAEIIENSSTIRDHIRTGWRILDSNTGPITLPDEVIADMEKVRREGSYADPRSLANLVQKHTGYTRFRSIIRRIFTRRSRSRKTPQWLEEFVLERYSVSSNRLLGEFVQELQTNGVVPEYTELELKKKAAIWSQFDYERAKLVREIGENFRDKIGIYNYLSDLARHDRSYEVRQAAIEVILPSDEYIEEFKSLALDILQNDPNVHVRGGAILALSYLRHTDSDIMALLVKYADNLETVFERANALLALEREYGKDAELTELIAHLIVQSIRSKPSQAMLAAFSIAGRLLANNEHGDETLFGFFKEAEHGLGRYWAFAALVRHFPNSKTAEQAVILDFENYSSAHCRKIVIEFISCHPKLLEQHLDRMINIELEDPDDQVRRAVCFAISNSKLESSKKLELLINQYDTESLDGIREALLGIISKSYSEIGAAREFLERVEQENAVTDS